MRSSKQKNYRQLNRQQQISENDPFTVNRYKQFLRHLPENVETVLDVGCNTGRGGITLKNLNPQLRIIGLDCLESRLAQLPDVYEERICGYSTDIPLVDACIDAILAGEFIEHLYLEDVTQTLREFYRLLKLEGKLLLTTPNPNYLLLKLTGNSVLGGAHVSQHYPLELKKLLQANKFDNLKLYGSGKVSLLFGEKFPLLAVYGSYLTIGEKSL